ncbi:MAG: HupE/UreJ family protein [SAR86 cluster bacterium]|uniref:HupE/UreJ family protein n=1 Tax=SAR86 cluster bacterium TaxID=2030880 RepID=A0A937JA09_9GAMM|nr:HupE/UreJ family protein [SAR86 cluster bacterium]
MNKIFTTLFFLFIINISAHEFNPAHLVIEESDSTNFIYKATWLYPIKNIGKRAELIFSDSCQLDALSPYPQGKYLVEKITLNCNSSIKGQIIEVKYLSVLTDALVTINFEDNTIFEGIMNLRNSKIEIPFKEQAFPTTYFKLGIDHLLSGIDHILFIFGLLFLVTGILNVIKTITAFTVAHSITLALSFFNLISLPQATVEVLIALTIVYLATEVSNSNKYTNTPWLMAFGFGLLHGLGFASALGDIGISNDQIFLSLLFFNIGIEAGQLALIPLFGSILWLANKYQFYKNASIGASYILGSMGFYWVISRFIGIII